MNQANEINIRSAAIDDCKLILQFIFALAEYENLAHEVVATESSLRKTLFGSKPGAEVLIAEWQGKPAGFALFFPNYSTFLGRSGIYLEDLFVMPEFRGSGLGKALLAQLARLTLQREGGRLDWSVLDWNQPSIDFYRSIGAISLDAWTLFRLRGEALSKLAEAAPNQQADSSFYWHSTGL